MSRPHKNPAAPASVASAPGGPYTSISDVERRVIENAGTGEALVRLDRKITDGLNLVHERIRDLSKDIGGDAKNGRDMKFTGFMAGNSLPGMPGQREVERSEGAERRAIIRRKRGLKVDALAPSRNLLFSTPMDTLRRWAGLCRAPP